MSAALHCEVLVIGAGPAGLAAVCSALEAGARVVCVDAGLQPGGQFWRHRDEDVLEDNGALHHGWGSYRRLRAGFDAGLAAGTLRYLPRTAVWMVQEGAGGFEAQLTPSIDAPGVPEEALLAGSVHSATVVLATGGYDRQLPVPGWELPGVMAAGGIQATIKGSGVLPGRRVLLAGTGPFLLPVAANVLAAGGEVLAICEAASVAGWLPHLRRAVGVPGKGVEGAGYVASLLRHRVPYRQRTVITRIEGQDAVERVHTARVDADGAVRPGSERVYEDVDVVGLGFGFTPQIELAVQLGATTRTDVDGSVVVAVDDALLSSVPGLFVAGEATGVGGAVLSVAEGEVAGSAAARASQGAAPAAGGPAQGNHAPSGAGDSLGPTRAQRSTLQRHRAFAHAMHTAHPVPPAWAERVDDDTIVCRCEEVTAGELRAARETFHAEDARTAKGVTRAGMGWCQGRMCGFATACLAAGGEPSTAQATAAAKRPVSAPVSLGGLAAAAGSESAETSGGQA